MQLLSSLLFSAARHSFSSSSQHVPGVNNQLADALSRFNWQEFWHLAPDAQPHPTVVPLDLLAHLSSLHLRTAVPRLLDPRPHPFYASLLRIYPSSVYFTLHSTW